MITTNDINQFLVYQLTDADAAHVNTTYGKMGRKTESMFHLEISVLYLFVTLNEHPIVFIGL